MSSTLDRTTGVVTITTPYSWAELGHRLAVKGSPAELRTFYGQSAVEPVGMAPDSELAAYARLGLLAEAAQ